MYLRSRISQNLLHPNNAELACLEREKQKNTEKDIAGHVNQDAHGYMIPPSEPIDAPPSPIDGEHREQLIGYQPEPIDDEPP